MGQPYLTATEYLAMPTAADVAHIVQGGTQAIQLAALTDVIRRASRWADDECSQSLVAARYTDYIPVRVGRDGQVRLHTKVNPVNQLVSISFGYDAVNLSAGSITGAWIQDDELLVIPGGLAGASVPGLTVMRPTAKVLAQVVYVACWPNTLLTVQATAGASSLTVALGDGFTPMPGSKVVGELVTIIDADRTETVTVASVAGNVLTISGTLAYTHAVGVPVSMLPGTIKEAVAKVTTAFLRGTKGGGALVLSQLQPGAPVPDDEVTTKALRDAYFLLNDYRRVR